MKLEQLRYKVFLSLLAALAVVIHTVESAIPTPFPWLKFGLANIITLAAIVLFGLRAGMTVTLLRVFVGSIVTGAFLTPAFLMALSGGVASTLVLAFACRRLTPFFSLIGVSILGACTHTMVQLVVAYLLLVRHFQLFLLAPVFLTFSVFAGLISGIGAEFLVRQLKTTPAVREIAAFREESRAA